MNKNIIYVVLLALLMPFAFGAECSDVNFESITVGIYDNSSFVLKIEASGGTPIVPWADYSNATISYDSSFVNFGNDFVDLNLLVSNTHTYKFNATSVGSFVFNVSVVNSSGVACSKNLSIAVLPSVVEPNVTSSLVGLNNTILVGDSEEFSVVLDNVGLGDAFNLSGALSTGSNVSLDSNVISYNKIANMSSNIANYTLTPSVCGANSLNVNIPTYYDSSNSLMNPITTINENFNVIGSNVDVLENSYTSLVESSFVTLNVSVKNIGDINASNLRVRFYGNSYSSLIGEVIVNNLSVNEIKNISYTWNSPSAGTYNIRTQVLADNECPINDREIMPTSFTVASTGGGTTGGGGGGGSSGGASSNSNDITYGTHQFKANDVINFESDGEVYTFEIVEVFENGIQIKNPENKILGLFENGNYKYNLIEDKFVRITLDDIVGDYVTLTFTKVEDTLIEDVVDNTTQDNIENKTPIDLEEESYNVTSGNYSEFELFDSNKSADREGFSLSGNVFSNNGNIWISIFIFILLVVVVLGYIFMKNKEEDVDQEVEEEK